MRSMKQRKKKNISEKKQVQRWHENKKYVN